MVDVARSVPHKRLRVSNRTGIRLRRYGLRGIAMVYLGAMIVVPVITCIQKGFADGMTSLTEALASPGAWEAIGLTLAASTAAAVINGIFGTMIAFALVRYSFRGRAVLSAIVDLPLAIPTLVTGVMLVALYGPNSPVGRALEDVGIKVVFAQLGILLALLVVTLPFVVRTVQPVLSELDEAEEEAAATLGASPWRTFRSIILPALRPAITAGALLVFARSLGEFGSVVLVSGNITGRTLTAPVFIYQLTSQFKPEQAAAVATILFAISFVVVLTTTRLIRTRKDEEVAA
jgi:sulfate/thiosulfate transport system permease protein